MYDYIKQNHLGLVIILFLIFSSFGSGVGAINRDTTTITNPFDFTQGMTSTVATFTGTITAVAANLSGALDVIGALTVGGTTVVDEFTQGGLILATSTDATATVLRAADLLTYSGWKVTVNLTDLTYTFPASSTLSALVPTAGDSRTWMIHNATTTTAIDVIFAAGTGSEIKGAGGAALTIDESSFGTITLFRKANSDLLILTNFPTAD